MYDKNHLKEIMKLQFYAVDLNLYLDNFPECKEATEDYRKVSHDLNVLIFDFENKYGPLTNFGSAFCENPQAWVDSPWPWENY
jgi:spore coat protein JB